MDTNEHVQVLNIVRQHTQSFTRTPTGVLISTEHLSEDCLREIETYVLFCIDQRQRFENDMKTRKTYEHMMN